MQKTNTAVALAVLLVFALQLHAQDTIDHRSAFPSGITLGYGYGSYAVKDQYISNEQYSGPLPYYNVEWVQFKCKSGFRLQFEYRKSTKIDNNTISADAQQFNFNQDYIFPVGKFSLFHKNVYAYLGPSVQVFYYEILYHFVQAGTFISPSTRGVIGSVGINAELVYAFSKKLSIFTLLRSNILSITSKKIDNMEYDESGTALLGVIKATKLDFKFSLRYFPAKKISLALGYIFDLSRINKWDPYIAASNSLDLSLNFRF